MKSHESDLLAVAIRLLKDGVAKCTGVTLNERDVITLRSRVKHEGVSFLTITLPTLGKDLDMALAAGQIAPDHFRSFRKRLKAPAFLQGFFEHVFDIETGRILHEPSIPSIEAIRQIAYAFKKLEIACTDRRVNAAIRQFSLNEQVFREALAPSDLEYFIEVSRALWGTVFGDQVTYDCLTVIPKHGPGATAEGLSGNAKFQMQRWHDRLEPYFPILDFAFSNYNAAESREFERITIVQREQEQPVRVIAVPKTLKTPRIIAIEPVCMQYTQQALAQLLVEKLESHYLTRGHVNFTNQEINRRLALTSSRDGTSATLDMSSASDLVPYEVAIRMFDVAPGLQGAISACRSTRAQLPSGEVIPLSKFASMGSALCFPVEAMYFYTICVAAMLRERNLSVSIPNILNVAESIFVYGDDIIVPTDESEVVIHTLQKYYCKVNVRKSFTSGKFRESCGMDAYDGEEVTPTYIRQMRPDDKRSTKSLVSRLAASNALYKRGYWQTADYLRKQVEAVLGKLPIVGPQCAGLGLQSFQPAVSIERWGKRYQRPEVRAWCTSPVYRQDALEGQGALLKCLLRLERGDETTPEPVNSLERSVLDTTQQDPRHLERTARYGAVTLKRRWLPPW